MVWGTNYSPKHLCQAGKLVEDDVPSTKSGFSIPWFVCWGVRSTPQNGRSTNYWWTMDACQWNHPLLLAQNQDFLNPPTNLRPVGPLPTQPTPSTTNFFQENDCRVAILRRLEPFKKPALGPPKLNTKSRKLYQAPREIDFLLGTFCGTQRLHSHRLWSDETDVTRTTKPGGALKVASSVPFTGNMLYSISTISSLQGRLACIHALDSHFSC